MPDYQSMLEGEPLMGLCGWRVDFVFVDLLKVCTKKRDLCGGTMLHMDIIERGLLVESPYLASSLINMYSKCGVFAKAQQVFEELLTRDTITWNALIAGYLQQGQGDEALRCFQRMQTEGMSPDAVTLSCILKACGTIGDIDKGKQIHEVTVSSGLLTKDAMLGTAIVVMYAKCGKLVKAMEVLKNLRYCDVVSWNALISGYVQQKLYCEVLNCFKCMGSEGLYPDAVTFTYLLKSCTAIGDIGRGEQVHKEIMRVFPGLVEKDIVLGTALVDMYAKCGILTKSHIVLEELHIRSVTSWNALIAGYSQHGWYHEASNCYDQMQIEGLVPNVITFVCILKACAGTGAISKGKQIHEEIMKRDLLENNIVLGNSLVDLYAKCGLLTKAREVLLEELQIRDVVSWNILITGYVEEGRVHEAFVLMENIQQDGIYSDSITFICILRACASMRDLEKGKIIHTQVASRGLLQTDSRVGSAVVDMYAKCGALAAAQRVFEDLSTRNVVTWNALISGYVYSGQGREAVSIVEQMRCEGIFPDEVTFVCILKVCGNCRFIDKGHEICDEIMQRGLLKKQDSSLGTVMVDMYARCGCLAMAQDLFDILPVRNSVSWSALIAGYAQEGQDGHKAVMCFQHMHVEGVSSDVITFVSVLKGCSNIGAIDKGMEVHEMIIAGGNDLVQQNVVLLGVGLVEMYANCGLIAEAKQILEELSIVSNHHVQCGGGAYQETQYCVGEMQDDDYGVFPNAAAGGVHVSILKACGSVGALEKGKKIHSEIKNRCRRWQQMDVGISNALVDMYAKCGEPESARGVLDELPVARNFISCWNKVIAAFAECDLHREAFNCLSRMQCESIWPDAITYNNVLKACVKLNEFEGLAMGKRIHSIIVCCPLLKADNVLGTALMDMYIHHGNRLSEARQVLQSIYLRDTISWNALIAGYAKEGRGREAINCFEWMRSEGIPPDAVTFVCVLKACGSIGAMEEGEQIHCEVVSKGWYQKETRIGNSLVDMYAKCGFMEKAHKVMEELPVRDQAAWSAMIAGYAREGRGNEAMVCYEEMQKEGITGNAVTMVCVLKACASVGAIAIGEKLHEQISVLGLLRNKEVILGNALVSMYAHCGMLHSARSLLQDLPVRNVVSWNVLISAYAYEKRGHDAFTCLEQMQKDAVSPDRVTFLSLLSACSHSGLLHKAQTLLQSMSPSYGVSPSLHHLSCMVMVFGFSGLFSMAFSVIHSMPSSSSSSSSSPGSLPSWIALLAACKKWGNVSLAKLAFIEAVKIDRDSAAPYSIMASILMSAGMPDEAEQVENMLSATLGEG